MSFVLLIAPKLDGQEGRTSTEDYDYMSDSDLDEVDEVEDMGVEEHIRPPAQEPISLPVLPHIPETQESSLEDKMRTTDEPNGVHSTRVSSGLTTPELMVCFQRGVRYVTSFDQSCSLTRVPPFGRFEIRAPQAMSHQSGGRSL